MKKDGETGRSLRPCQPGRDAYDPPTGPGRDEGGRPDLPDAAVPEGHLARPEAGGTVLGVGIDLVEVQRIGDLLTRHPGALRRLFAAAEVTNLGQGSLFTQRLAARFALKEAVYKALGGTGTVPWREIVYVRKPGRPAFVRLEGRAKGMADRLGITRVEASISHVRGVAIATVTALGGCPTCGS